MKNIIEVPAKMVYKWSVVLTLMANVLFWVVIGCMIWIF